MKLSVIIIAKNAENFLANCIESVNFADEIIVVDNNSTDKTLDMAKRLRAKVVQTDSKNFSELRNIGLEKAKGEWVLFVDTDERVSKELKANIQSIINHLPTENAYKLFRQNFYFGNYPWPKIEKLERLFKKSAIKGWYGELHESPKIEGETGELNGLLLHYTHRDLSSMVNKTIEWSDKEARLRLDSNHPKMTLWRFPRVMLTAFWDSYVLQQGWKVGTVGLIESIYQAFSIFITYAKLWELQNQRK